MPHLIHPDQNGTTQPPEIPPAEIPNALKENIRVITGALLR